MSESKTFEAKIKRIEEIVSSMESEDLSLEDSLKAFEEGVKLSRECQKSLDEVEQKVEKLLSVSETGELSTESL